MAQDPEPDDEQRDETEVDPSHELDMVTLYDSSTVDAEIEAEVIRGLLESNDVPVLVVGAPQVPNLGFQIQVPRARLDEARRLVEEAQKAGPDAAAEAEAAGEAERP